MWRWGVRRTDPPLPQSTSEGSVALLPPVKNLSGVLSDGEIPSILAPVRFVERPKRTNSMTNKENRAGRDEEFPLEAYITVHNWIRKWAEEPVQQIRTVV